MKVRLRAFVVLLFLIPATVACSMWKQPGKGWNGATAGEQLEKLFWDELKAKNYSELEKHVADTVVSTTATGIWDKASWMQHLKEVQLDDYSIGEVEVKSNGGDMMVAYVITLKGSFRGQPLPAQERMLTVWQQVKKGYIMVAHSAVPMAAEH